MWKLPISLYNRWVQTHSVQAARLVACKFETTCVHFASWFFCKVPVQWFSKFARHVYTSIFSDFVIGYSQFDTIMYIMNLRNSVNNIWTVSQLTHNTSSPTTYWLDGIFEQLVIAKGFLQKHCILIMHIQQVLYVGSSVPARGISAPARGISAWLLCDDAPPSFPQVCTHAPDDTL